eukprot:12358855-Ditylum_brightwellii.AAC.1
MSGGVTGDTLAMNVIPFLKRKWLFQDTSTPSTKEEDEERECEEKTKNEVETNEEEKFTSSSKYQSNNKDEKVH